MVNRILLSLLAGLYPALFFASNNWFTFTGPQLAFLIVGMSLITTALIFFLAMIFAKLVAQFIGKNKATRIVNRLTDCFCSAFAFSLCAFLFRPVYTTLSLPTIIIWLSLAGIIVLVSWSAYKGALYRLNICLIALTLITTGTWIYSYVSVNAKLNTDHWYNKNRNLYRLIKFARKPNVYFLLAEAYPNRAALETIYNIDNTGFYDQLELLGFSLYHSAFSNYHDTLSSMASLFAMEHHYNKISAGNLDSFSGRDIIAAKTYNGVVDIFKNNGYLVQYIHQSNYMLRKGASLDYYWPSSSIQSALIIFLTGKETMIHKGKRLYPDKNLFGEILRKRLISAANHSHPYFTFIYIASPGHSPIKSQLKKDSSPLQQMATFRKNYYKSIEKANEQLLKLIDQIITQDSSAVIIVAGDHGAWGYRLYKTAKGEPVPERIIILDRLGILVAIRFPKDCNWKIDGEVITNVNLFRNCFACLTNSKEVFKTRVPDDGYIEREGLAIRNGRILDQFVKIESLDTQSRNGNN